METVASLREELFHMTGESKIRRKRSLGPLKYIGKLHRFLYGSLDEDDKEFFDNQINSIVNSTENTLTLVENQTQIVKNKFLKVDKIFTNLTEQVNKEIVVLRQQFLQWNQEFVLYESLQTIAGYITLLNRHLTDLELDTELLINAIIFAKEGQIHPKLLKHETIINLKNIIENSFREVAFPLPTDSPTITELAKLCNIAIYVTQNKLTYVLNIPLVSMRKFTLYEHFSIPVKQNFTDVYAFIEPSAKFVALSWDTEYYFLLNERQLSNCKKNERIYVCDSLPIYRINENSPCEIQFLANRYIDNSHFQNCNIRIKKLMNNEFKKLYKRNAWLYSLVKKCHMSIICNHKDIYNIMLHSSGVLELQPDCIAKTETLTLTPVETISSYRSQKFSMNPYVNISAIITKRCNLINLNTSEIFNITTPDKLINDKGESLDNIVLKARDLKNQIKIFGEMSTLRNSNNYLAILTLSTLILLTLSFLLIKFKIHILCSRCYARNNTSSNHNQNTERIQLEVLNNPQVPTLPYNSNIMPICSPPMINAYQQVIPLSHISGKVLPLPAIEGIKSNIKYKESKESRHKRLRIS